ncbi:hypothetical protein FHX42_003647 [Saccharopolyspora lacisalsi]|uniref:Uncharacterized protein n=1 Tax=Halosaccharopolyspora lacisalsi TaxID=1000566 RepID=A0A839E4L2_9PSEU|nr:hypothetical protein [Halosaccharopolyspora lacisalsi]
MRRRTAARSGADDAQDLTSGPAVLFERGAVRVRGRARTGGLLSVSQLI